MISTRPSATRPSPWIAPLTGRNCRGPNYNNFYEFGSSKRVAAAAQALEPRPWSIAIDGLVEEPRRIDADQLIRRMPLEERLYRFRCVEAWAMAVPWTGFPMRELIALARPLSSARYVLMETFENSEIAPGQRQNWYPWPYTEALTLDEANHDLTMMVTRRLWKAAAESVRRAVAAYRSLEIRLQIGEIDRAHQLYRRAPGFILGRTRGG